MNLAIVARISFLNHIHIIFERISQQQSAITMPNLTEIGHGEPFPENDRNEPEIGFNMLQSRVTASQ